MIIEKTSCHSYFSICSSGQIRDGVGVVADAHSDFDPAEITARLGIEPFETRKMGTPRKRGTGVYPFSDWACCRQAEPAMDAQEQCRQIVRRLRDRIPVLQAIKREYHVDYTLMIVPHIYHEESPVLGFDSEIIDFCYHTGTQIAVDAYIYDKE